MENKLLTSEQVCEMLGIEKSTLFIYVQKKRIRHYKVFKKLYFLESFIMEFLKTKEVKPIKEKTTI